MTQFFFPFTSIGGDRRYNAKDFANYFHSIFTDGVIATVKDKLRVSQTEQVGMQVVVNTGAAFIHGHLYLLSEPIILSVTPGSATSDRVDSIVLRLDHLERDMKILYKQGTTSVQRDENYWELQLATIDVPRNATQVWNRQINDTRADKSVGGYSKLQGELDVEGMEQHYESLLQQLTQDMTTWSTDKQTQLQDDWNTWFATVRGVLEGDVATNLLNMITQLQSSFNAHQDDGTAHGIGDRTNLETNEKGTIVGAMNELFTNVSDGKSLVGGAITGVDDSVVIPTDPTFQQLASAISGISTGGKTASGTGNSSDPYPGVYFRRIGSDMERIGYFDIIGLDFEPSVIIAYSLPDFNTFPYAIMLPEFENDAQGFNRYLITGYQGLSRMQETKNHVVRVDDMVIIPGGYRIPAELTKTYTWIAFE